MRLKSLHIKGFKSFANETILNFSEDVIGVVGPNGSGKSNIVDAIRWVLGEQKSKELRLEAMSDVIFNGTKTKKEAATATVALTFDNDKGILPTEYQTVTISRTLYRSGESEYKLNNVVCRLKDINSLFLDTGIGSNSYAIIALGMVDDILADKENSRRRMFEQAAGISKYKIRKRETLSKLKSATEDLNRIDDLLFEIEGNLKSLEKQAKRTQKYLDIKTQYKDLSIQYAIHSVHHLKEKYKGISEKLVKDQDLYRQQDTLLYKKQADLEKEKKANTDKELALSDHQKKLNELVYRIRSSESEKDLLKQKLGFKKQNKEQALKSILENEAALNLVTQQADTLQLRLNAENDVLNHLKTAFEVSQKKYQDLKQEYNLAKQSFDQRQRQKQELEKEIFDLDKAIAISTNNIENIERDRMRLREVLKAKSEEIKKVHQQLKVFKENILIKENEYTQYAQNESNRLSQISELESQRDKWQDELNGVNRNIDSKQNEYDLLKSMIESFEGFPESIKFLSDEWRGGLTLMSDILEVEERYKAPIELYLENYLNYFIVQDTSEAIRGVTLLKNAQKGKANFFILNLIPQRLSPNTQDNRLICAADVVKVDDTYNGLLQFLLGHVFIYNGEVDELGQISIAEGVTILSSSGTFLSQKHIISGGSVGLFEGKKLGRKKNLEKLAAFLSKNGQLKNELTHKLQNIKNQIAQLKSADFKSIIDKIRKEIQSFEQDQIRLKHQSDTFEQFKIESDNKINTSDEQIKVWDTQIQEAQIHIALLKEKVRMLDKPEEGVITDIDVLGDNMSKSSEKFNQDNIALIRHQNLIGNFVKDKEFAELKIKELQLRLETDAQKSKSLDRERIDIEDQMIQLDKALQEMYVEKKSFQSTLSEAEQLFFDARNTIHHLDEEIRALSKSQSQLQQSIQDLKDQYSDQKFQIQSIGERLRIEFNVAINDVINNPKDDSLDYHQLTEELDKIKIRLQSFGDVNPLAVEAYNEMKERYDNIQVQRKDILEAKDSLMETMKEIEDSATERFMEAFTKVRTSFIEVFRSLFTEDDTCDLVLLDAENPLESNIEIIAKPKGKKPKSLSQLSGGEKTLTATALLFALYLLKPAPFCIFDEVDAPLDDANIQKFNNIIRKFSKESQFIIVTHNKSTMAEVNVLYGVYMVEPGVSAVSAVDFRSLKHEPILETLN